MKITCKNKAVLCYQDIVGFQGDVKTHTPEEIDMLVRSIDEHGFFVPLYVWKQGGKNYCIDGHGRLAALAKLELRGDSIPPIPVVFIEASSMTEAKKKYVEVNNVNGDFSMPDVKDFVKDLGLDMSQYNIPGLDFSKPVTLKADLSKPVKLGGGTSKPIENKPTDPKIEEQSVESVLRQITCPKCGKIIP
jgi:hypothetical protein